jgi:hypothetical protein
MAGINPRKTNEDWVGLLQVVSLEEPERIFAFE